MSWTEQDLEEFASTPVDQASDDVIARWTQYLFSPAPREESPEDWHDVVHDHDGALPSVARMRDALEQQECTSLPVAQKHDSDLRGSRLHNLWHIGTGTPFNDPHPRKH